jgi:hypothetical protein
MFVHGDRIGGHLLRGRIVPLAGHFDQPLDRTGVKGESL